MHVSIGRFILVLTLGVLACQGSPVTATIAPPTPSMTAIGPSPSTNTPLPLTATPGAPTPTLDLIRPYTIEDMRQRDYPGGTILISQTLRQTEEFTQVAITYPSDGLTITGMMQTPAGQGPFPAIILLHGYWPRESYGLGTDTQQAADYLTRLGYLTIAPDLRSWGESDVGLSLFHTGLAADVINLISSLKSIEQADSDQVALWGHSMGGGLATKVLTVDSRVRAAVLYAPNSANDADLIARWGPGCLPGQSEEGGDHCNPAEVIPAGTSTEVIADYLEAAADPDRLRDVAPIYHLEGITASVQIHSGSADGQGLAETPPEWSQMLAQALRAAGVDSAFYEYPGEGHFFTANSWNLMMARAAELYSSTLHGSH